MWWCVWWCVVVCGGVLGGVFSPGTTNSEHIDLVTTSTSKTNIKSTIQNARNFTNKMGDCINQLAFLRIRRASAIKKMLRKARTARSKKGERSYSLLGTELGTCDTERSGRQASQVASTKRAASWQACGTTPARAQAAHIKQPRCTTSTGWG